MQLLIVGTGISGATLARCLAEKGHKILIIDKKEHLAGNCFDFINESGIRVHKYGPHLFHTSNDQVYSFLSRFTEWIEYKHKVKALLGDHNFATLPVNKHTLELVGGRENAINTFIRPYTKKMWGLELEEISPDIINRIPFRDDDNDLYFPTAKYQALPSDGYTKLIQNMLDHHNISIKLGTPFCHNLTNRFNHIFNSMPIDEFFNFKLGRLAYRSIKFLNITLPLPYALPTATVNFTHSGPHTRVTEWQQLPNSGKNPFVTTLTFEEPCDYKDNNWEAYYPVKDVANKNTSLYQEYKSMTPKYMTFIGRCGTYRYIDMDKAVEESLSLARIL